MQLTVSFKKGKSGESSIYHNNRSIEKKFDYDKKGHEHIRRDETKNNVVLIHKNLNDVYDEYFDDAVVKYNEKQRKQDHPERQIKGITKEQKEARIKSASMLNAFLKLRKSEREIALEKIKKQFPDIYKFVKNNSDISLRASRKLLTEAKHARTYGQNVKSKFRHDKTTTPTREFIAQVGNVKDFNITDDAGFLLDKDGNRIVSDDPDDPTKFEKSKTPYLVRDPNKKKLWKQANQILIEYLKDFQEQHPDLVVVNAVVHNDEATPHLHITTVPVAGGYKRGLSKRASFNKVLANEGFKKYNWVDENGDILKNKDGKALSDDEADKLKKEKIVVKRNVDSRKPFKDFRDKEANALAQIMYEQTGISRKLGETNHYKNIHEYKKAMNAVDSAKNAVDEINIQKQTVLNEKTQAETARDKVKNDLIDVISQKDSAQIELADIQAQAEALASWNKQKEEEKRKFEEKLKKEKVDQEKALQERKQQLDQREKYVESNENSFRKLFHQFKENYMLAGLEDLDDNFKKQNDIYMIASNWADVNSNSERAKNAEKAVFDKHPARKIKAFLFAITSAFGRVNNIDTALDNQQDVIDEQKVDQSKQTRQKQQDEDLDDDF